MGSVLLLRVLEDREKMRYLSYQHPTEACPKGQAIALALLSDRPTAGWEQDQPIILSSLLVHLFPSPQVRCPQAHTSDTTSTSHP